MNGSGLVSPHGESDRLGVPMKKEVMEDRIDESVSPNKLTRRLTPNDQVLNRKRGMSESYHAI